VDERELRELLESLPCDERLLIQERAEEPLVGLALVVGRDGSQVARFQQVAERTWPERAGGSTVAVSVEPDLDLAERATTLLADAGYWGLAQLQFLTTGRGPALIDVNTRFYGSMPLALAAGVNLPAAWHAVVMDRADGQPPRYSAGVRYRWLEGEIVAGLRGSPNRLLPLRPRPRAGAVWLRDDPVPSALLAVEMGWSRVARRGRRMRPKA
jgi:predicted ATP-grasp superfamily ATP-dependent carboligase